MIGECFVAAPGGAIAISDLRPGDLIYSFNDGLCINEINGISSKDDMSLFRFITDNHTIGHLTTNQNVVLRDGSVDEIYSIKLKTPLMPFSRNIRGHEWSLTLFDDEGTRVPEHHFVAGYMGIEGEHIHHIDGDHMNNRISNLMALTREEHDAIHREMREKERNKVIDDYRAKMLSVRKESWRQYFATLSKEEQQAYWEKLHKSRNASTKRRVSDGTHNFVNDNPMNDPEKIELMKKMKVLNTAYQLTSMGLPIEEGSWNDSVKASGLYKAQCFRSDYIRELFGDWSDFIEFMKSKNTKLIMVEFDYKGKAFGLDIPCIICDIEMKHGVIIDKS